MIRKKACANRFALASIALVNTVNSNESLAGDPISTLLDQARTGSDEARANLFSQLRGYLSLVAERDVEPQLRPKLGASDLVQESMAVAIEKFDQFRGTSQEELYAWLSTIIKNELKQQRRYYHTGKRNINREQRMDSHRPGAINYDCGGKPETFTDQMPTPGTHAVNVEQARALAIAMSHLPEEYQSVIKLRNWERLSFRQVAIELNKTESQVTRTWYRALVCLQSELDHMDE